MKWFLQFLSLGSAVLYTLLVIIDNRIPDGIANNTVASEAHSNQHRLSAWGPYLPNRSPGQNRQASTTTQPTHQQNTALAAKPYRQSPRQYFDDQPTSTTTCWIGKRPEALPITGGSFEPTASSVKEEANWVFIIRGAIAHSGPSVSAPIVRLYSVGTELHLTDYQHGVVPSPRPPSHRNVDGSTRSIIFRQFVDPARWSPPCKSLQRPSNLTTQSRTPHVRRAKKIGPRPAKKVQPSIASASRYRYQTVASILDRALRP